MKTAIALLLGALLAPWSMPAPAAAGPVTALVGGTVVDVETGRTIPDAIVLVAGERIIAVGPADRIALPAGARVIRTDGRWLLPGLMDMHVHLGLVLPGAQGEELAHESEGALALRMADNARASLYAGTTSVRLTGEEKHVEFAVKAAIDHGTLQGPRIWSAGEPLIPTGGHGAEFLAQAIRRHAAEHLQVDAAEQLAVLDDYLPEKLTMGNGRKSRISYAKEGPPVLSARIQELYGVEGKFTLGHGRVPVKIEVLAPNQRPIQVTDDLTNFWREQYPKIKTELSRRYPRHEWR